MHDQTRTRIIQASRRLQDALAAAHQAHAEVLLALREDGELSSGTWRALSQRPISPPAGDPDAISFAALPPIDPPTDRIGRPT
jgi:hypothetical protein